jgi:anoctamin-10/anoctamin-7
MIPMGSLYPKLYKKHELENGVISEFSSVSRIKIMQTIFEGPPVDKCCGLNLSLLMNHECVEAAFPLHNPKEKVMLEKKWLRAHQLPWKQPLWDVKSYFGEKVALYFAFVGHMNSWLMPPAVAGLMVYINMAADGTYTVESQMYFGVFLAVWSTLVLEFWKRKEKTLVMMWGMTGFEEEEADRPEFEGEEIASPVNGEEDMYFPESEMLKAMGKTTAILGGILCVLIGVFASVFALGAFLNLDGSAYGNLNTNGLFDIAQLLPYMICAGVIMVGSRLFESMAVKLSDLENHRTDTQYEDAVIAKTFIFEFFNSYSACFYVIFLKAYAPNDACVGGCIRELHYLMGCIFFSIIIVQCTLQVVVPIRNSAARAAEEKEGADPSKPLTAIEKQFMLEEYDAMFGSFKHFKDIAIQFGYAILFSSAFPLAPALAFVSTYFEIRVDAWVLLQKSRRAIPTGAEDIGTWQSVFECLGSLSVITNMGIAFVVSASEVNAGWVDRMVSFLIAEHLLFFGQMLFAQLVDDVPATTAHQIERQEFLASKVRFVDFLSVCGLLPQQCLLLLQPPTHRIYHHTVPSLGSFLS